MLPGARIAVRARLGKMVVGMASRGALPCDAGAWPRPFSTQVRLVVSEGASDRAILDLTRRLLESCLEAHGHEQVVPRHSRMATTCTLLVTAPRSEAEVRLVTLVTLCLPDPENCQAVVRLSVIRNQNRQCGNLRVV